MGVLDFLFDGQPPEAVTTYGQNVQNLPTWMNEYVKGVLAKGQDVGMEPYQVYPGPRVAPLTPDQQKGFEATRKAADVFRPYLNKSGALTEAASSVNPSTAAAPYFDQANAGFNVDQYMDPYITNVTDRATTLAKRTLNEDFLPSVNDIFTSSGQFGSTRHQEIANRGLRDIMEGLNEQSLAALSGGFQQAGVFRNADLNRALQTGTSVGNLSGTTSDILSRGATGMGGLAQLAQALELTGASGLSTSGETQQEQTQKSLDTGFQDFLRQQEFPKEQLSWMKDLAAGLPVEKAISTEESAPWTGGYGPSGIGQLGSLASVLLALTQAGKSRGGVVRRGALRHAYA